MYCSASFSIPSSISADKTSSQLMVYGCNSHHVLAASMELPHHSLLLVKPPLDANELVDQDTILQESAGLRKRCIGRLAVFGSEEDLFLWADDNLPKIAQIVQSVFGCSPSSLASTPSSSVFSSPSSLRPSSPCPSLPSSAFNISSSSPSPHPHAASTAPIPDPIGLFEFDSGDDFGFEDKDAWVLEYVHAVAEADGMLDEDSSSPRYEVVATARSIYPIGLLPLDSDDSESEEDEVPVVDGVHAAAEAEGTSEGEHESESESEEDDDPPHWGSSSGDTSGSSSTEQIGVSAQESSGRSEDWMSTSTSTSSIFGPTSVLGSTSLGEDGSEDSEEELDESLSRDVDSVGVRASESQSSSVESGSAGLGQGTTSERDIATLTPSSPSPSLAAVSASSIAPSPPTSHLRSGLESWWETLPAEQVEARAAQNAASSSTATLVPSTSVRVETDESPHSPRSSSLDTTSRTPHLPSAVSSSGDSVKSSSDSASRSSNTAAPSSKSRKRRLALSATPSPNLSALPPPSSSVAVVNVDTSNSGSPRLHQSKKRRAPALISGGPRREPTWYAQRLVVHDPSSVCMPPIRSGKKDIASRRWLDYWRDWWAMAPRWERIADAPLGEFRLHFFASRVSVRIRTA